MAKRKSAKKRATSPTSETPNTGAPSSDGSSGEPALTPNPALPQTLFQASTETTTPQSQPTAPDGPVSESPFTPLLNPLDVPVVGRKAEIAPVWRIKRPRGAKPKDPPPRNPMLGDLAADWIVHNFRTLEPEQFEKLYHVHETEPIQCRTEAGLIVERLRSGRQGILFAYAPGQEILDRDQATLEALLAGQSVNDEPEPEDPEAEERELAKARLLLAEDQMTEGRIDKIGL
jgi:hypothetical protein